MLAIQSFSLLRLLREGIIIETVTLISEKI
jgi:hypothetical protein